MKSKHPLAGRDPRKPFYMGALEYHMDGSVDIAGEAHQSFESEAEVLDWLKSEMIEHGDDAGFVFLVTPVAHAKRGKLKVTRL